MCERCILFNKWCNDFINNELHLCTKDRKNKKGKLLCQNLDHRFQD